MRDHYSIDRIPTILALAKNPVFEGWKTHLSWNEVDTFDWAEWAINWMMQLYYGSLAFEYFDYWENEYVDYDGSPWGEWNVADTAPWTWIGGSRDKTKDRAFLEAGATATILAASKMTRLDTRDAHLWLLDADGKGVDENNPIVPGNIYSVPNTVLIGIVRLGLFRDNILCLGQQQFLMPHQIKALLLD